MLLVTAIAMMFLTRIDRVVTSNAGKLVSLQSVNVFQALDPSIIKSIDVREGDEVQTGQLLATLDPTFAAADVKQLKQQIASLQAQIARDEAQLDDRSSLVFPESSNPDFQRNAAVQKSYYDQQ